MQLSIVNFNSKHMYTNLHNPPQAGTSSVMPRIEPGLHQPRLANISRLLTLISRARERLSYSRERHDTWTPRLSPFVTRGAWQDDIRKWSYICYRLERCYLKKICELNSITYKALSSE